MAARTTYKLDATRTFGIEIEAYGVNPMTVCQSLNAAGIACQVEGYNHATSTGWKIVSDSSIVGSNSFELVSPPLAGADGIAQVTTVCQVLQTLGVQVNRSCGLHVHHDANDLSLNAWKNLSKLYLKYEATLDSLLPRSRRMGSNNYCKALRSRFASITDGFAAIDQAGDLRRLASLLEGMDRYHTLNLTAFWRHGTVEVRHHSGTIEAEKILHWVSLTQCLVLRAIERDDIKLRFTGLSALTEKGWNVNHTHSRPSNTTILFYEQRQAAFAAQGR